MSDAGDGGHRVAVHKSRACACHPGQTCDLPCLRDAPLRPAPQRDSAHRPAAPRSAPPGRSAPRIATQRIGYLLAELDCARLRAELWVSDIQAVSLALAGGLIHPEQALELLADCDCLHLVHPTE